MPKGKGWGRVVQKRNGSVPKGGWAENNCVSKNTPNTHFFACLSTGFRGPTLCVQPSERTQFLLFELSKHQCVKRSLIL